MTTTTRTLPRRPRRRGRQLAAAAGAATALLALTAGLPALLYLAGGSPIPHHMPTWALARAALTRPDDGTLFLAALRYLGWAAWAAWTISLSTEGYGQARGRRIRLAGLGGMQGLSRILITAVMLGISPGTAALPAVALASVSAPAPAHHSPHHPGPATRPVTVHHDDCLYSIAARYLGDGNRWQQIFNLNHGRIMHGGQRFTSPDMLQPGWTLQIPATPRTPAAAHATHAAARDLTGTPGSSTVHEPHPAHPGASGLFAAPHPAAGSPAGQSPALALQSQDTTSGSHAPAAAAGTTAPAPGGVAESPVTVFAAGLLAGGILTLITQRRHRQRQQRRPGRRIALPASRQARAAERALRTAPDGQATRIRSALTVLATALRDAGKPFPAAAGIHATGEGIDILLTEAAAPPEPFTTVPGTQDMCWRITPAALRDLPAPPEGGGELLPGLITAGQTAAGGQLLLDLEAAGVTTASGPGQLADRYLITAAAELATNPWAGGADLLLEGFPEMAAASPRAQACASLEEAITILEDRARHARGGTASRQRRLDDPDSPEGTLTLLAARTVPSAEQMTRLLAAARPGSGIAAIAPAAGEAPAAPSRITLREDHGVQLTADLQPLALVIWPRLLDETAYRALREIFAACCAPDIPAASPPYDTDPAASPLPAGDGSSPAGDDGRRVRISILGPLTVTGTLSPLQPKHAELVVALALAGPGGLTSESLRDRLGPDEDHPKPAASLRQGITRTRRRLGRTPDGSEYILHTSNGRYRMHEAAILDWDEFRRLARAGRDSRDPGPLREALDLVRGAPLDGLWWWWLDPAVTEAIRAEIVDAATLLAELEMDAGDPAAAGRAARAGLAADNAAEQLWRAVMRAEHEAGNTAGVHDAWRRCLDVIAEIAADGEPHPDTRALYRELTRKPAKAPSAA